MRCGFVRWCQGARRLRSALSPDWHIDLIALRDSAMPAYRRLRGGGGAARPLADPADCPGLIEWRSAETEAAARACVRALDAQSLVPRKSSPASAKPRIVNLLKWALWSLEGRYDLVFYSDLDVDPMPASLQGAVKIGVSWRQLVATALRQPTLRMIASADSMAPVHGGLFLVRPSNASYRRGLATLTTCAWNHTHGWNYVGRPRSLRAYVPRHLDGRRVAEPTQRRADGSMQADLGGTNQPKLTDAFRWDDWSYWGASVDQGLLFYEFFARSGGGDGAAGEAAAVEGVYSRWSTPHKVTHEWGGRGKPWEAMAGTRHGVMAKAQALSSKGMSVARMPASISTLAIQLRYLMSIDLNGTSRASGPSQCVRRLWQLRRDIEEDPRFDAISHRMADTAGQNPTFAVW